MREIKFYSVKDNYGFFSNFSPFEIFADGEVWKTVEHYFQTNKFEDEIVRKKIKMMETPMLAAIEGRHRENKMRQDWEYIKENVMQVALRCKFLQHPKLRKELLLTGTALIIEHTNKDNYWADGGNGLGKNRLGILLMKLREEIELYSDNPNLVLPPWLAFPTISQFDLFWRMGLGEEYLTQWSKFYLGTDKNKYRDIFPEPSFWENIYD
jgi:N-glycosidase YbiA